MNLRILLTAFLLGFSIPAVATEQESDFILYHGALCRLETHWLFPSPLQAYFADGKHGEYPFPEVSTANYRGHVATYEIADKKLYLAKIDPSSMVGHFESEPKQEEVKAVIQKEKTKLDEKLRKVFAGRVGADGRIPASWYSGHLRIFCTPEKKEYQNEDDKSPRVVEEFTEIALLKIYEGTVVKEMRFPLAEYWEKFRIMQQRREIPQEEAEAITGHLEFLDSNNRDWNKTPGAEPQGPLRTEADFSVFLTRQLDTRVRIPLSKFTLVKNVTFNSAETGWIIDSGLRIRPGANLLMLEMTDAPSGPWSAHTGGSVQVLIRLGELKNKEITFTEKDTDVVKQINNYAGHRDKEDAKYLQGTLQMEVTAEGKVLLTGTIRLTSKEPTTYQEIALNKNEVPVLALLDYLKAQDKGDELLRTNAEEVYQQVLERTKSEEKPKE